MAASIDVVVLVQEGCHFCRDAQRLLARLALEYPLQIRTMDLRTREGEGVALAAGMLFPPGILLQGKPFCYGRPSEGKLRRGIEQLLIRNPGEFGLRGAIEGILAQDAEPGTPTTVGSAI